MNPDLFIIFMTVVLIAVITISMFAAADNEEKILTGLNKIKHFKKEENKKKILKFIAENNKATNFDLRKLVGKSRSTIVRYTDELEEEGKIVQIDKGKYTVYKLAENPEGFNINS